MKKKLIAVVFTSVRTIKIWSDMSLNYVVNVSSIAEAKKGKRRTAPSLM